MKTLIALSLHLLASCTSYSQRAPDGSFVHFGSIGGSAKGLAVTPRGMVAEDINHDKALDQVRNYVIGQAVTSLGNAAAGAWTRVAKSKQVTDRARIAESGQTARAGIAADVQKAELANQTEFIAP